MKTLAILIGLSVLASASPQDTIKNKKTKATSTKTSTRKKTGTKT